MAGISSKAAGAIQNKEKTFQGQRFDDELGLNWVQFKWRNHDPQIGRFVEIDPLSEKYECNSTYAFSENKVIAHVELEGLESIEINTRRNEERYFSGEITQEQYSSNIKSSATAGVVTAALVALAVITSPGEVIGGLRLLYRLSKSEKSPSEGFKKIDGEIKQLDKSKNSFEKLIKEHKEKLEKFKEDPVGGTKKELLEGKSPEVQQKIMDGRVKALEKQIKKQEGELNKVNDQIQTKKEELKKISN